MHWLATLLILAVIGFFALRRFVRFFIVDEGHVGLFFRNGRLAETLPPGLHYRAGWRLRMEPVDTREQEFSLAGQEVLTADNVTIKLSLAVAQRVADAPLALRAAQWWHLRIHTALQIALRAAIAKRTFDEVLRDRAAIGDEVRAQVAPEVAEVGVEVPRVALRDVMLSAELRRAFAEALRLREEGKAALEKARSETAALRSLANAARMLKDNPDLLSVRLLQSIETVGTSPGNTLVLGAPFDLPRLAPAARPATAAPDANAQ